MKNNFELRSTLYATWCAADLIRLNFEKLLDAEPSDIKFSDYASWCSIGHLLLRPGNDYDRLCGLWGMAELFSDLVERLYFDVLSEVKHESAKGNTAPVVDLATFRNSKGTAAPLLTRPRATTVAPAVAGGHSTSNPHPENKMDHEENTTTSN